MSDRATALTTIAVAMRACLPGGMWVRISWSSSGWEQRVHGQVIDALRSAVDDLNLAEAGPVELAGKVVFGQGSSRATGPGSRMGEHFGREVVLFDSHVGHAELSAGPKPYIRIVPQPG